MCIGVQTYVVYVVCLSPPRSSSPPYRPHLMLNWQGSLWYFDAVGQKGFPIAAGVIIGIGAGMVFIVAGYISLS